MNPFKLVVIMLCFSLGLFLADRALGNANSFASSTYIVNELEYKYIL